MKSIKKIDNKSTLSIGTESQYSTTSPDFQSGGGMLSYLFGSNQGSYATELALDAFNNRVPQVGSYILKDAIIKSYSLDFSKIDQNNRNLLHHIVIYSAYYSEVKQLLLNILSQSDAKKYINIQDNKLNTPAHYALYLGMEDIVKLLAENGANLTLKNSDGYSITLSEVPVNNEQNAPVDIFIKMSSQNCANDKDDLQDLNEDVENKIDNIIKMFVRKTDSELMSDTIGFKKDQESDTSFILPTKQQYLSDLKQQKEQQLKQQLKQQREQQQREQQREQQQREQQQREQQKEQQREQQLKQQTEQTEQTDQQTVQSDIDSVDILNMIMNEFKQETKIQQGGKKYNVSGKRKMVSYSELSIGGSSDHDTSIEESDSDDLSSIARAVENKASEAHKRSVERIKEILGIEEIKAKAYKALIYEMIKNEHSELSNYDKAMELEKRASDEKVLKSFSKSDVTKMLKLIEERQREREERMSSSSSEKPVKSKSKKFKKSKSESTSMSSESGLETISSIDNY